MAHVEDKDGNCCARWKDEFDKWRFKKIGRHTKANHESAMKVAQYQETEAIKRKHLELPPEPKKIPFSKAWEQYQQEVEKKSNSMTRDTFSVIPLLEEFGDDNLSAITLERLKKYKAKRRTGYEVVVKGKTIRREPVEGSTINRELAPISHMFTYFQVFPGPTKEVERFPEHPRIRFLELDEINRLLAHAGVNQRPIIQTALNSGFGISDILALTWDRINFTRRTITLSRMKTDVPMIQPMTDALVKVLQAVPRHTSSPYVFCDAEGRPFKRIVKGFTAAVKRAGIKDFHFHDLRHTFASHYLMQGGDLKTLQVLMGHKTIAMTAKYAHLAQRHLDKEIQRLDNLFGGNGNEGNDDHARRG